MIRIRECIHVANAILFGAFGSLAMPIHAGTAQPTIAPSQVRLLKQRAAPAVQLPDGRVLSLESDRLVVGGSPISGVSHTYPLPATRTGAAPIVLADGRILIWGGVDAANQISASGWWFDAVTGHFAPTAKIGLPAAAGESFAVLSDGQVLMAGGLGGIGDRESLTRWNPISGEATSITTSLPARIGATATLQGDGNVALSKGWNSAGMPVDGVQRFDPTAGTLTASKHDIPDASRLSVVSSLPVADSSDNAAGTVIGVRLSRPIDPRTASPATVSLIGPAGPQPASVAGIQDGRLIFVTPPRDLLTDTAYTLVMAGVRGTDGQRLPFTSIGFHIAAISAKGTDSGTMHSMAAASQRDAAASQKEKASNLEIGSPPVTLYLSTGVDAHGRAVTARSCNEHVSTPHLCRKDSYIEEGAWYPGQDNAGEPGNGRWRLNRPEMSAPDIARYALTGHRAAMHVNAKKMTTAATGSISGTVVLIDDHPVAHVRVAVGTIDTYTDASGRFTLDHVRAGHQSLFVDGSTADHGGREFGQFAVGIDILPGTVSQLPYRMHLPRILDRDKIELPSPTERDMVVTHPDIPGLEIHIPAGTVVRSHDGRIVTELAIVPMPVDRAPYPSPVNFPVYFSLQPGGATVENLDPRAQQGITLTYPNYGHVPAGTPAGFLAYSPEDGWREYGKGAITPDGAQLKPEVGVHLDTLTGASWEMGSGHPGDPKSGNPDGPCCGDPVDLDSGTLVESQTDAVIGDIIPIRLTREWHAVNSFAVLGASPYATDSRMFGGWRSSYDMYVYSATGDWDDPDLGVRLPNGHLLAPFKPLVQHPGSDGTWQYDGTVPRFAGAVLDAPLGQELCQSPDSESQCYSLTTRDGTQYWFDVNSGLYRINDRFGNAVTITRSAGLVQQVTSPSGRYLSFHYNANNNVTSVTDNTGRTWHYSYHRKSYQSGNWSLDASTPPSNPQTTTMSMAFLDTVTYPDNTSIGFTYDEDFSTPGPGTGGGGVISADACPYYAVPGTLLTMTDRNGETVMSNTYCSTEVTKQVLADGSNYQFAYHQDNQDRTEETDVTDPLGHVRQVQFDLSSKLPSAVTEAYGTALAQTTTYIRDGNGLVQSTTDPLGRTTTFDYDANGNVTRLTALAGTANAVSESFAWTLDSQLASHTDVLGHITNYTYTNGCLTSVTDPLGHATAIHCNGAGQPLQVTDALSHTTTWAYQGYDLRSVTDPLGRTATFAVDSLGRLDAVTDPLGHTSLRQYDSNDRLTDRTDPTGQTTHVDYDNEGHVTRVTLPSGGVVATSYTPRYWVDRRTDALGQPEHWTYDGMGNALTYTDRNGQVTTYAPRDALGRFVQVTYADGSTITADTYDAGNRLLKFTDSASGSISRSYDDLGHLTGESSAQGTVLYDVAANGLRLSMTAADQASVTYAYDDANRLTGLNQGNESVGFTYDAANRRTTLTLPNGVVASYSYDDANELTAMAYTSASNPSLGTLAYSYDSAGRRTAVTGTLASDLLPTATTTANTFDLANRQTSFNGQALSYDQDGHLIGDGTNAYVWNARGQLAQIQQNGTTLASFSYDATGRRVAKTVAGVTTDYLYDGFNAVQETQGSQVDPILTGLGIDERFARDDGGTRSYFLTDALGSTVALANAGGTLLQRYQYDPYGNVSTTGGASNPYQYTGRENDGTGLYYYRARYYSPALGRFISEDPAGFAGGQDNFYAYVDGNPLSYVDPYGLWAWGDPVPQWLMDYSAGLGDAASLEITSLVRDAMGTNDQVDKCSTAYKAGGWSGFALGAARVAYAGLAKVGAAAAASGVEASTFRSALRRAFGGGNSFRPPDLFKYATDDALRAAAGRTNLLGNTWGAGVAAAGAYGGSGGACSCQR